MICRVGVALSSVPDEPPSYNMKLNLIVCLQDYIQKEKHWPSIEVSKEQSMANYAEKSPLALVGRTKHGKLRLKKSLGSGGISPGPPGQSSNR